MPGPSSLSFRAAAEESQPHPSTTLPTPNQPRLSFLAAVEESQLHPSTTLPTPNQPRLSFRAAVEESQPQGDNRASHHKPTLPVIPSGSRGIPTVRGMQHGHAQPPCQAWLVCGGWRGSRLRLGFLDACGARNDRLGGPATGAILAPRGCDSSAVARNDRKLEA